MAWVREHWLKVGILLLLLFAVILIAYYFMVFVPDRQDAQLQAAQAQAILIKTEKESTCKDGVTYMMPQIARRKILLAAPLSSAD